MEPVPETEKMEAFNSTPLPILRLQSIFDTNKSLHGESPLRPANLRRSTDPTSPTFRSPGLASSSLPYRQRNTSPFSRGHGRSKSSHSTLPPPISRTQSLPGIASLTLSNTPQRPASPRGSPHRQLRKPVDEAFPGSRSPRLSAHNRNSSLGSMSDISETIPEDEELPHNSRSRSRSPTMLGQVSIQPHLLPRVRRSASPLRQLSLQNSLPPSTTSSLALSPSYQTTRFSDSYASYNTSSYTSSSSVPSTPTSLRSRSPSISSLETIPDTPDAEEAAIEAYRLALLRAGADETEGDEAAMELKRRAESVDGGVARGRTMTAGALGTGLGRDKRKRWSVCGGERRGDLDLETIWED